VEWSALVWTYNYGITSERLLPTTNSFCRTIKTLPETKSIYVYVTDCVTA